MVFTIQVTHVLFADVLRLQRCLKAFVCIAEAIVQQEIGREGDMGVAQISTPLLTCRIFVLVKGFGEVLYAVAA